MKSTYIKHGLCIIPLALSPKTSVSYGQKQLLWLFHFNQIQGPFCSYSVISITTSMQNLTT